MENSTIQNIIQLETLERMENFGSLLSISTFLPELISLPVLAVTILVMYQGVEIDHPIYKVLFNNLIFLLFFTVLIICSAFPTNMKIFINVSGFGNLISLLHHHSSWMVLSGLRYAYIVKPDWLHSTWPDVKQLRIVSVSLVYITLIIPLSLELYILKLLAEPYGFPKVPLWVIPHDAKIKIGLILNLIHSIPAFFSLLIYICLVFATTNKLSKVGILHNEEKPNGSKNIHTTNKNSNPNSENLEMSSSVVGNGIFVRKEINSKPMLNAIDFLLEETNLSDLMHTDEQNTRANHEKTSALGSLQTNLVVYLVAMAAAIIIYHFPDKYQEQLSLINASLQKLLIPTLTTVANFGTIRNVTKEFLAKLFVSDKNKSNSQ